MMISEEEGKKEVSYHQQQQRLETDDGADGCMSCASPPLPSSKPPGQLRGATRRISTRRFPGCG